MANDELIRCMGVINANHRQRVQCNECKRLPRNSNDEEAAHWIAACHPCRKFSKADEGYLTRHPIGTGPF